MGKFSTNTTLIKTCSVIIFQVSFNQACRFFSHLGRYSLTNSPVKLLFPAENVMIQ